MCDDLTAYPIGQRIEVGVRRAVDSQHFGQIVIAVHLFLTSIPVWSSHGKDILQNIQDFHAIIGACRPAIAFGVFLNAKMLYGGC